VDRVRTPAPRIADRAGGAARATRPDAGALLALDEKTDAYARSQRWHASRSASFRVHPEPLVADVAQARVEQFAAAIEAYLAAHPGAADSARGIADWWLVSCGGDARRDEIDGALDVLVGRGSVDAHALPDGTVIYRAGRAPARPATG
jgi:hypothetical protein